MASTDPLEPQSSPSANDPAGQIRPDSSFEAIFRDIPPDRLAAILAGPSDAVTDAIRRLHAAHRPLDLKMLEDVHEAVINRVGEYRRLILRLLPDGSLDGESGDGDADADAIIAAMRVKLPVYNTNIQTVKAFLRDVRGRRSLEPVRLGHVVADNSHSAALTLMKDCVSVWLQATQRWQDEPDHCLSGRTVADLFIEVWCRDGTANPRQIEAALSLEMAAARAELRGSSEALVRAADPPAKNEPVKAVTITAATCNVVATGTVTTSAHASDQFAFAKPKALVDALNQVLGAGMLNPGVFSRVCTARKITTRGGPGKGLRVDVDSFLAWARANYTLPETEVVQLRNAVIGEILADRQGG